MRRPLSSSLLLYTPLFRSTLSPDPQTRRFECGMRRLDLQSASLSRGTLPRCCPLLTLPMGATLSPDLMTTRFECSIQSPSLHPAPLPIVTRPRLAPLLTPP